MLFRLVSPMRRTGSSIPQFVQRIPADVLALIAEFETEIRRERQMEGIARAKAEGRSGGRPSLPTNEIRKTILRGRKEEESIRAIATKVGLSKATVHKVVSAAWARDGRF